MASLFVTADDQLMTFAKTQHQRTTDLKPAEGTRQQTVHQYDPNTLVQQLADLENENLLNGDCKWKYVLFFL
ncbi:hypothetical protein BLNAU_25054 [Blattamonas nauphoetae]|uniref:Uncharacterized protein n=1 Tax=Blattamonas nauphoetae TaxID=2049346 RepID=A0ABQ9WL08_9EUKA|nr:hypothetical protein BLNAU_25054 [Blattamonas nauphoetae]